LQENSIIVEQLGDDNICTSIALFLQMLNIVFPRGSLSMDFWISSHDDAEIVSVSFLDKCY
jgi:hypothetical protein